MRSQQIRVFLSLKTNRLYKNGFIPATREVYLEVKFRRRIHSQTSMMKLFAKNFNNWKPFTTLTKRSMLNVWLAPECASVLYNRRLVSFSEKRLFYSLIKAKEKFYLIVLWDLQRLYFSLWNSSRRFTCMENLL